MGDPESADASWCPTCTGWTIRNGSSSEGYHHVEANYRLLNDNLLDLSHETYVHAKTIGHEAVAETPISIRVENNAVYVDKEMPTCNPPPFYQFLAKLKATEPRPLAAHGVSAAGLHRDRRRGGAARAGSRVATRRGPRDRP